MRYRRKITYKARKRRYFGRPHGRNSNSIKLRGGAFKGSHPPPRGIGIDDIVNKNDGIPFSDDNLRKICEGKANILTYRNVMAARSLEDVLGSHGAAIILYETKPQYGHWCCMFSRSAGVVEFFDPYGYAPDEQLKFVPAAMGCRPVLAGLCRAAGVKMIYSPYKLQQSNQKVSTCGRWVSFRIAMRESYDPQSFAALFMGQKLKPDAYVNLLTSYCNLFT